MPTLYPQPRETITGLKSELSSGKTTPTSILNATFDHIMRHEPDVRAWVRLYEEEAVKLAEQQTARLAAGEELGLLAGVPIGIKDIIDIAGSITGCGFTPFSADSTANVAERTAPIVQKMLDADAILLGKTTTTQFACFDPTETTNPWNEYRTPGGSSSGSAAAVASGMCLAAVGTQTGGSVTRPAAYCGVVGFKPGFGTLPMEGIFPLTQRLDHAGFFTRSLEDAELLWNVCRETKSTETEDREQLRIGHLTFFFADHASSQVREMMATVSQKLLAAGHQLKETGRDIDIEAILAHHRNLMVFEAAQIHHDRFTSQGAHYQPAITGLIQSGLQLTTTAYQQSCAVQDLYRGRTDQYFQGFDLLICAATLDEAPPLETTGDPRFNAPWSFLGLPTITIPVQLSQAGLPLGLQLIGPAGSEDQLLKDAALISNVLRSA